MSASSASSSDTNGARKISTCLVYGDFGTVRVYSTLHTAGPKKDDMNAVRVLFAAVALAASNIRITSRNITMRIPTVHVPVQLETLRRAISKR